MHCGTLEPFTPLGVKQTNKQMCSVDQKAVCLDYAGEIARFPAGCRLDSTGSKVCNLCSVQPVFCWSVILLVSIQCDRNLPAAQRGDPHSRPAGHRCRAEWIPPSRICCHLVQTRDTFTTCLTLLLCAGLMELPIQIRTESFPVQPCSCIALQADSGNCKNKSQDLYLLGVSSPG